MMNVIERYVADIAGMELTQTDWGSIGWLVNGDLADDASMSVGVMTLGAGQRAGEHLHTNSEEIFIVFEGECDHTLGDEVVHLTPGMMIRCPVDVPHYAMNTGRVPMRALVIFPVPDRHTQQV